MPRVYLAGPMSGHRNHNYDAFYEAAEKLRALGYTVLNPAELTCFREGWDKYPPNVEFDAAKIKEFARCDVDAIFSLTPESEDMVVMLENWSGSKGAFAEYSLAVWLRINHAHIQEVLRRGAVNGKA